MFIAKKLNLQHLIWLDHYTNVFPILDKYNIQGSFFPPAKAVMGRMLEVNKIHFILSKADNVDLIISDIFNPIDENRLEFSLKSNEYYSHHYLKPSDLITRILVL